MRNSINDLSKASVLLAAVLHTEVFTARCYAERGYEIVSRLSVRLSVRDVEVSFSHKVEYFENNFPAE